MQWPFSSRPSPILEPLSIILIFAQNCLDKPYLHSVGWLDPYVQQWRRGRPGPSHHIDQAHDGWPRWLCEARLGASYTPPTCEMAFSTLGSAEPPPS
jgi:hypothetical protein